MKYNSFSYAAIGLTALLFLTGCSNSSEPAASPSVTTVTASPSATSSASSTASASSTSTSSNVTLKTMETSLGKVIVGGNGMTVYYFTKDTKDSGESACVDDCRQKWPPVLVEGEPKLEGVTAKVGTIDTPEGKKQVTVDGMPVYYWYMDKKPGDVFGQDVGKVWYVVAPDGKMIQDPVPTSTASSSTTESSMPLASKDINSSY